MGSPLHCSFLSRKTGILLLILIVTTVQPLIKTEQVLKGFCLERAAHWSRCNQMSSYFTNSFLMESGMLKDFSWSREKVMSSMLWWICWVLVTVLGLQRLIVYFNIALTAISITSQVIVINWVSMTARYMELDFSLLSFIFQCFCFGRVWQDMQIFFPVNLNFCLLWVRLN